MPTAPTFVIGNDNIEFQQMPPVVGMLTELAGTIHIEKEIKSPVSRVYNAFKQTRALKVWYDPRCRLKEFARGGRLVGDNYPSAEILALVPNQTIVHRYDDIVSGLGIWSFIQKKNGKFTRVIFDHIDGYDSTDDRDSIAFYWKGLIENLAAFCENREIPFDHDSGEYKERMKLGANRA